ncbi:TetR/AcrR family transcriptional regulator [Kordiimonas aquimaris]|uniref:TetR/AcrR family transcriptional regulator n=1 Tax=Kordiimonas aquimaris TaxID=707591 RepID=UPI0021D23B77|nr:TetR/AcrR family transcriptional regulator [Kordiimonas aquimaris]
MARPLSPDYGKRKQLILEKSAEMFAEHGYHKASIDQLADACGMSKSLIYHYFKSKHELLFQCMKEHVTELHTEAERCAAMDTPAVDRVTALLKNFMTFYENAGPRHRILVNDLTHLKDEQHREIVAIQDKIIQILNTMLADSMKSEKADNVNGTVLSLLLLSMINWTYTWYDPKGPITPDQLGQLVSDIFMNGVHSLKK